MSKEDIEKQAKKLYEIYCKSVGGKAFNGDTLPSWEDFASDPKKEVQVNAWRDVAFVTL